MHRGAPQGREGGEYRGLGQKANPAASVQIAATIEDAVSISQMLATSRKQKIYVAGGLFLAVEYATVARGGRAQDLDFF